MKAQVALGCMALILCMTRSAFGVAFDDDFDSSTLNPIWTWNDPDQDDTHSLTARPGHMRIKLASGSEDSWTGATWATARNSAPFLLTSLVSPSEDFVVETMVDAATVNGGTMPDRFVAGIMIYDTAHETTPYVTWQGPTEYFGYDMGLALYRDDIMSQAGLPNPTVFAQACNSATRVSGDVLDLTKAYHLKVVRDSAAATWTCSYKQDGAAAWTALAPLNDWEFPGGGVTGTMRIGLYAKTWVGGTVTPGADFGYFRISSVPEPSAIVLAGFGLVGLLTYAWRKHR